MDTKEPTMAMTDITESMNSYRECSRNLWNVYFSRLTDYGAAFDAFENIRRLLFDSLVVDELFYEGDAKEGELPPPALKVVPGPSTLILIKRPSDDGNGYWDEVKDMVVGPDDIELEFLDYFDFTDTPVKDFHFYRCKILSFSRRPEYQGRDALINALDGRVFHDESQ